MRFRQWLSEDEKDGGAINHQIDAQGLILFFSKDNDIYGAPEGSRVVFARMKHPQDDDSSEDASFSAQNLSKLGSGEFGHQVFGKEDIKKIKILDRDEAVKKAIGKHTEKTPDTIQIVKVFPAGQKDRDEAPNMIRADEE